MTESPIEIELPTNDSAGKIIAATVTMLRRLGWELGAKYDAFMQPQFGDGWLEWLRQERIQDAYDTGIQVPPLYKHPLNLRDPQFCINEPFHNDQSPLRNCLHYNLAVHDLFKRVRDIRNREQHFQELPTLTRLKADSIVVGKLAQELGLPMTPEVAHLVQRVNALIAGDFAPPADASSAALSAEIEAEKQRAQQLAGQVAQLRDQLRANQSAGAAAVAEIESTLEAAEAARAVAEEKHADAQAALELQLARERAAAPDTSGLTPGDTWPAAPPARLLRLMPFTLDLYDPNTDDLLSNTVGDVASEAAALWAQQLPNGGVIHLSEAGEAVALVGASWTFLGKIESAKESPCPDTAE